MRYKQVPGTNMNFSVLSVGTWAIGGAGWGEVNKADCISAIRTMLDLGVNVIDTAPSYNAGESERIVGEAVSGRRDKTYIVTKTAVYTGPNGQYINDGRRDSVLKLCEQSLKNLKTDYIDLMLIHWPDKNFNTPIAETMGALNDLKKEGKIRYIGVSNFSAEQIEEASQYGKLTALEPHYSMVNRDFEELMKWTHGRGMANLTYGSLGAGILTGTIREMPNFAPDDMRLKFYDFYREPKFSKVQQLLKVMDTVSKERNVPLAQIAINWSTQKDYVTTALCGVRNENEAKENCAGTDWSLSCEEIAMIDKAIDQYLG